MAGMMIGGARPATSGYSGYPNVSRNMGNLSGVPTPEDIAEQAAITKPQYVTSPTGHVSRFNIDSGVWDPIGSVQQSMGSGGGATAPTTRTTTAARPASARNPALDALMAEVRGMDPTPIQAPTMNWTPTPLHIDEAANRATYGAAKERTGAAMQSAMRGLRSQLAQRGIVGSGIDADKTAELYGGGLSALAATDRQMAEEDADRIFAGEEQNAARATAASQWNADAQMRAAEANQAAQMRRLDLLSRLVTLY